MKCLDLKVVEFEPEEFYLPEPKQCGWAWPTISGKIKVKIYVKYEIERWTYSDEMHIKVRAEKTDPNYLYIGETDVCVIKDQNPSDNKITKEKVVEQTLDYYDIGAAFKGEDYRNSGWRKWNFSFFTDSGGPTKQIDLSAYWDAKKCEFTDFKVGEVEELPCVFLTKEDVYHHVCEFLKSNPSKEDIQDEINYLSQQISICPDVSSHLIEAGNDLVQLYMDTVTTDDLISKYCECYCYSISITNVESPAGSGKIKIYGYATGKAGESETFQLLNIKDGELIDEKTYTFSSMGNCYPTFEVDVTDWSPGSYKLKICACGGAVCSSEVTVTIGEADIESMIEQIYNYVVNNDKNGYIDYVTTNEPVRQNFPDIVNGLFEKSIEAVTKAFEWTLDIVYDIGTQFADLLDPFLQVFDRNYAEDFINMLKQSYDTFVDWFEDVYTFLNIDSWTGVTDRLYPIDLNTFSKAFENLVDFDEQLAFTEGMLLLAPICGDDFEKWKDTGTIDFENWKDVTMTILNWLVESIVTLENLDDYLQQYKDELAEAFEKQGFSLHGELYGKRTMTTLSPFAIPAVVAAGALVALEIIGQIIGWEVFHLFICEEFMQQYTMAVWNAIHAQDWVAAEKALKNLKGALIQYWILLAIFAGVSAITIAVTPFKVTKIFKVSRLFKEVEFAEKAQKALQRAAKASDKINEAFELYKAKKWELASAKVEEAQAEMSKITSEISDPYKLASHTAITKQKEHELNAIAERIKQAIRERDEYYTEYFFQYEKTKLLEMQYHMSFWQKAGMALLGGALSALSAYVFFRYGLSVQSQIEVYERIITAKTGGKIYKPPEPGVPAGLLKVYTDPAGAFIYVFQDGEWRFAGKSPGDTIILPVGKNRIKLQLVDYRGYMWEKELTVEVERIFTPGIINSEKITEISVTLDRVDIVPKGEETVEATVIQAISGDVLDVETEYGRRFRVKLAGVNAPKLYKDQIYCENCGAQAISWKDWFNPSANQLNALIQGQTVTLKIDQDEITVREYNSVTADEEEMVLAVVYKGDENINVEMIKTGFACADFRFTNKFVDKSEFLNAQNEAIAGRKGFFSVIQCEVKLINVNSNVYSKLYIDDIYMGEGDMLQVSVSPGQHEIVLVADGYYALKVKIDVTDSGVSCLSAEYGTYEESTGTFVKVGNASCNACYSKENGVCISGFTIDAYLKAKEGVTPPPTKPPEEIKSFEDWLNSKGGCPAIKLSDILELREAYFGFITIGFTVLVNHIATARECYFGLISSLSPKPTKKLEQNYGKRLIDKILNDLKEKGG